MKSFFDNELLINNKIGLELYNSVKELPIVDYHCHLNEKEIESDNNFKTITELWLAHDHYKWRVMRSCGVDEKYITGDASDYDKFYAFASIMPKLMGNSVYYWAQLELKIIFGVSEPLNKDSALKIYTHCNQMLKTISPRKLLNKFKVELLCTTDDPISSLQSHGTYDGIKVLPTFRPDALFNLDDDYIEKLSKISNVQIVDIYSLKQALRNRIDYFISKGCKISDHGMDYLPGDDIDEEKANDIFLRRNCITDEERFSFFSHMMHFLAKVYKEKNIVMQLHFATFRNINTKKFQSIGRDSGFDVIRHETYSDRLAYFLDTLSKNDNLPKTILYSLNSNACKEIAVIAGSFDNVKLGPAWWLNDTRLGNREMMEIIAEYSTIGTFLGMLTDSRSFSSYVRFDFFRRILADLVGEYVERGEFDKDSAFQLMQDVCYNNIKNFLDV